MQGMHAILLSEHKGNKTDEDFNLAIDLYARDIALMGRFDKNGGKQGIATGYKLSSRLMGYAISHFSSMPQHKYGEMRKIHNGLPDISTLLKYSRTTDFAVGFQIPTMILSQSLMDIRRNINGVGHIGTIMSLATDESEIIRSINADENAMVTGVSSLNRRYGISSYLFNQYMNSSFDPDDKIDITG
jgi:hypothetical protein